MSPNPVEIWIQTPTYTRREKATEGEGGDLVIHACLPRTPGAAEEALGEGPAIESLLAVPGPRHRWDFQAHEP